MSGAPSGDPVLPANRLASLIDHTLLRPEAIRSQVDQLCAEAREHAFAAVCVNGAWVGRCADLLQGSAVKVAAVVAFPLGATTSGAKASEARRLIADGAGELDMVAPIGHILDGEWAYMEDDIAGVVEAARGRAVKVIIEAAALDATRIIKASVVAREAGAAFVKTSTGFHPAGGATIEAVSLIRAAVGPGMGIKASGGIRDPDMAGKMIAAGATRIGTSSSLALIAAVTERRA